MRTYFYIFLICLCFIQNKTIDLLKEKKLIEIEGDITDPLFVKTLEEKLIEEGVFPKKEEGKSNDGACLADKSVLQEIGINDPDDNQRFIMGKCNPIVFSNGVYAARLSVEMNCKGLSADRKKMQEIRVYCGNAVCTNETKTYEEYVLWPVIMVNKNEFIFLRVLLLV
ncbi:MAG: hypothetical protein MJ252_27315 [archaeon]|nr:hypothetical protein [archaeon]